MKSLPRIILAAGLATFALLLWKFDPRAVWADVSRVGWGFAFILPFQIFDHMLNAVAWRYAFRPSEARTLSFWRLVYVRIAGDGVNYLTPSGTIAGELVRPGMLGGAASEDAKNSSVVVAKFAQALGQALFILLGLFVVIPLRLGFLGGRQTAAAFGGALLIVGGVACALYLLMARRSSGGYRVGLGGRFEGVRDQMRAYLAGHPARFALSTLFFIFGYAWGAFEVLLICRFLGVAMNPLTAFAVEVLSNVVDSLMFMVPAKIGTQEAGKTAIFAGLGLPAASGLAFGLIRHVREVLWAGAGLLMYAAYRREAGLPPRTPGAPPTPRERLAPAD